MPAELGNALKSASAAVSQYIQDVATMVVETRYIEIDAAQTSGLDQAQLAARTVIRLDGDSQTTVPMRKSAAGGISIDTDLFEIHQRNVSTAIEYRARILGALVALVNQK
jgi:hypothetical protein